jgi:[lysine-biosynthesis-protein LysW]---L-2-aminoadipate ligase
MSRRVALLGTSANETNVKLVAAWQASGIDCELLTPAEARRRAREFRAAVARLDVLPTLDGVEPGLLDLLWLERTGVRVHNSTRALLTTHDKLRTALALTRAGLPHPLTRHIGRLTEAATLPVPIVLKPRFGSWGKDVRLCPTRADLANCLDEFSTRTWFRRHGVLAQQVIPSSGYDLRLVVAGERVIGAIERHAAPGEWRTNISVGGSRRPTASSPAASALAIEAAAATGAELVGVDLLPLPGGGYTVIELNGAVDFDADYCIEGDVYEATADALAIGAHKRRGASMSAAVGSSPR